MAGMKTTLPCSLMTVVRDTSVHVHDKPSDAADVLSKLAVLNRWAPTVTLESTAADELLKD